MVALRHGAGKGDLGVHHLPLELRQVRARPGGGAARQQQQGGERQEATARHHGSARVQGDAPEAALSGFETRGTSWRRRLSSPAAVTSISA
jgi:hypothetical protein